MNVGGIVFSVRLIVHIAKVSSIGRLGAYLITEPLTV